MSPNDQQYSYYYNSSAADQTTQNTQNTYAGYQPRENQYGQHARQTSSSTPAQNYNYQQAEYSNDQAQQGDNAQSYYGSTRDGGQRAAETLSRMGSAATTYPATTATTFNQTPAENTYSAGYNQASTSQYPSSATVQSQTSSYPAQTSYATSQTQQARPSSVNSVRSNLDSARSPVAEPMQQPRSTAASQYSHTELSSVQQQRSASPAQIQASHQLQRLADQRTQEATQPVLTQQSFVDPCAVYDPWPEYQRKLVAAQAVKEAEDRAAAEREAEENWEAKEEAKKQKEAKQRMETEEKERKKAEATQRRKEVKEAGTAPKRKRKSKDAGATSSANATTAVTATVGVNLAQLTALSHAAPGGSGAEEQIRSLMAMVKQMNDQHPDLLAKIWEQERQQHLDTTGSPTGVQVPQSEGSSSSPSKKKKKTSKKAAAAINAPTAAEAKRDSLNGKKTQAKAAPSLPTSNNPPTPAMPTTAATAKAPAKTNNTARGTIWPPEKKDQIAAAATRWLNSLPGNRGRPVVVPQVAEMLDKNPTYIELCEMIEKLGFKIERAAFAKALLTSVPDVNPSAASPAIPRPPSTGRPQTSAPPPLSKPLTPLAGLQAINRPPINQPPAASPTENNNSGMQLPAYQSPYFDSRGQQIPTTQQIPKIKGTGPKQNRKPSEVMDAQSDRPSETPGPITKAEAARKRTFADLVDLTALSDDDLPPAKHPYFGPPPVTQPGQAYSTKLDFLAGFKGVVDPYLQQSVDRWPSANTQPPALDRQAMTVIANKLNTMELAKPIDRKNALRRSKYDVRTLARDVLLATGKHPDLLPLNGHLESLRSVFTNSIGYNSDLATVRWDLIDPGEPVPAALENIVNDDKDSVIDDADDESEEEERHFTVRAPSQMVAVGASGVRTIQMATPSLDGFARGKLVPSRGRGRPRGRPPGVSRLSAGGAQTPIGNHHAPAPHSASPALGYSQFNREVRPDGPKRRGRPLGWRKDTHGKGVASGSSAPHSASKQVPPTSASEPKFTVYKCSWKDCGAQLHNLEILRRHVKKKHSVPDKSGKFSCFWGECGRTVQTIVEGGDVSRSSQRFDFPDTTELMEHVENKHIKPIAWELGDGPPGGFSDSNPADSEAYLSDRQGRRVTPTVPAAVTPGPMPSSAPRSGQRGRPPKKSDEEKAKESQAELAKKKREIGLAVDRQGATLATDKRRAGFVDDEDGEEVFVDAMEE